MTTLQLKSISYDAPSNTSFGLDAKEPKQILDNISLSLEAGSINTIIGENGAGKSSLLKVISGDISAYTGQVLFNGKPLTTQSLNEFSRSLAVLPQFSVLSFPFLCKEVVALGRTPHASGLTADNKIVDACLKLVGMSDFFNQSYIHLSGGEKQRIQLARVFAQIWRAEDTNMPRLLILDEPCQSLDLSHQIALMKSLQTLATSGVTILMVLHDISLAARYSDNLIALKQGRLMFEGAPSTELNEAKIEALLDVKGNLLKDDNGSILGWLPS